MIVALQIMVTGPPDQEAANGYPFIYTLEEIETLVSFPDERPLETRDTDFSSLDFPEQVWEPLNLWLRKIGLTLRHISSSPQSRRKIDWSISAVSSRCPSRTSHPSWSRKSFS